MGKKRLRLLASLALGLGIGQFVIPPLISYNQAETLATTIDQTDGQTDQVEELNTFTVNYLRQDQSDVDGWNFWIWPEGKDGAGIVPSQTVTYKLPDGKDYKFMQATYKAKEDKIGVIPRKGEWETQDGSDRYIQIPAGTTSSEVWLVEGHPDMVYTDLNDINFETRIKQGYVDSASSVLVTLSDDATEISNPYVLNPDGTKIAVGTTKIDDKTYSFNLPNNQTFKVNQEYMVGADQIEAKQVEMRKILDQMYYSGDDLGLTYSADASTFKVWAPTASSVELAIFDDEGTYNEQGVVLDNTNGQETLMTRDDETGVWSLTEPGNLSGKYYMYKVSFADGTVNYAVDPYARSVSANGQRTAIIDLSSTDPEYFSLDAKPPIIDASDSVIYELHVKDFSIDPNAPFKNKGQFNAFTETGLKTKQGNSVGIDHLKELGVTHVHLLPSYDFASVNELSSESQFNWGYDPQNYNVPEGSYSSDPSNPTARVTEFKNMVSALHDAGIRVVMDVVYNHTYSVKDGPFDKIVPNYYYRTKDDGTYSNGSGCGNEVASERPMVRKYITDSVKYWADEYNIDGFRFDLMGLIDTQTMSELTEELRTEIDPDMLIYGEPWQAGGSILHGSEQTLKGSQKGLDFKVFNDNIRGAIKGDSDSTGKGFATGAPGKENDIIAGVKGAIDSIALNPTEVISYVTAHDNLNLWDKVIATQELEDELGFQEMKDGQLVNGGSVADMVASADPYKFVGDDPFTNETVQRSILANGIALTSQGVPFIQSGEEILKTKYGDHNSYKSPDEINMIRWDSKDRFIDVNNYYAGLINLRKDHPAFTLETADEVNQSFQDFKSDDNIVGYLLKDHANGDTYKNIAVIYNANTESKDVELPFTADWNVVVNNRKAGTSVLETLDNTNTVSVAPLSMMVLYDESNAYDQIATNIDVSQNFVGLGLNDSKVFDTVILDQKGVEMSAPVQITSSNPDVVQIYGNKVVANQIGTTTLTFTVNDDTKAQVDIQVVDKLVPSKITIKNPPKIYADFNVPMKEVVTDQFDQVMLGEHVNWSVLNQDIATIGIDGTLTGKADGTTMLTASIGDVSSSIDISVIPYEKRYIQLEYNRPDGDYAGWNLWVWNTGVANDRIEFEPTPDGKMVANIEIGPSTESIGFIVRQSVDGNDWAQKDTDGDRTLYAPKDQTITKVKVNQGQIKVQQLD